MIIKLTYDMARLALKLNVAGTGAQLMDYEAVQLVILPRPRKLDPCIMGSPLIVEGCWPHGLPCGVDLANPWFDFVPIILNGFELDDDGRIVFVLDQRVWELPAGRYDALLKVNPDRHCEKLCGGGCGVPPPAGFPPLPVPPIGEKYKTKVVPPEEYAFGFKGCCTPPEPPLPCPPPPAPMPPQCILAEFELEIGPRCTDHVITEAAVEYTLNTCGDD